MLSSTSIKNYGLIPAESLHYCSDTNDINVKIDSIIDPEGNEYKSYEAQGVGTSVKLKFKPIETPVYLSQIISLNYNDVINGLMYSPLIINGISKNDFPTFMYFPVLLMSNKPYFFDSSHFELKSVIFKTDLLNL